MSLGKSSRAAVDGVVTQRETAAGGERQRQERGLDMDVMVCLLFVVVATPHIQNLLMFVTRGIIFVNLDLDLDLNKLPLQWQLQTWSSCI